MISDLEVGALIASVIGAGAGSTSAYEDMGKKKAAII
jgi:hypothetical protein